MYNVTTIGEGLGFNANRLLGWGLGYQIEVQIVEIVGILPGDGVGGRKGDQRRTYLFLPREIRFSVRLLGSINPPVESVFENSNDFAKSKIFAKKEPLFVKAKKETDGID